MEDEFDIISCSGWLCLHPVYSLSMLILSFWSFQSVMQIPLLMEELFPLTWFFSFFFYWSFKHGLKAA